MFSSDSIISLGELYTQVKSHILHKDVSTMLMPPHYEVVTWTIFIVSVQKEKLC